MQRVNTAQIRAIIRLKLWITLGATLTLWVVFGPRAAFSGFIGGAIACCGSVVYAMLAYGKNGYVAPVVLIKRHFLAELIKMGLTLCTFALTFILFRQVTWVALFVGYMLATTAYWLGLLFKFEEQ